MAKSRSVSVALASLLLAGCATFAPTPQSETGMGEIRPEKPAEFDVLVAQDHEVQGRVTEAIAAYERAFAKDPNSAYIHQKLAEGKARQGNPLDALEHAKRALEIDPESLRTRLFLGQLYRLRRDVDSAESTLVDAADEPINASAAMLLYQVYLEANRLDDAAEVAHWMIDHDAHSMAGYAALARVYEQQGHVEEATATLRRALESDPGNLKVYAQLARAARKRGDAEAVQKIYREILELHPHHHTTLSALADLQLTENDTAGAKATLGEIERHFPDDLPSILRLGFLHYEAEELEQAAQRFERYLTSRPKDGEVLFFLGIVHRRLGDDPRAVEAFAAIPDSNEHYPEARTQLAVLYERSGEFGRALEEVNRAIAVKSTRPRELYSATLRAKTGDFHGAVEYLEGLLIQNPDDDEILYNLGVAYGEAKLTAEAIGYMERAIEHNPKNASALNYVGYTLAESGANLDRAEEYIVRALDLRPDDGFITDSLGWVYYMRARPLLDADRDEEARRYIDRALKELLRAEELTGGDPVVSEHLGDTYLLLDQRERALEKYEEAVEQEPRHGEQPDLVDKLESLRRQID